MAFFELYKKDQGKYVRWGTAGGIALMVAIGMYWIATFVLASITDSAPKSGAATQAATQVATQAAVAATEAMAGKPFLTALYIKTIVVTIFGVSGALLAFWLVNRPKSAEFMIMTESEMRKVNWPTRREVWINTKVVVILTVFFALLLGLADFGFLYFFQIIKLLPKVM